MSETRIFTGMSDASAAVALDENNFIVATDEENDLRIYDVNKPDQPQLIKLSEIFKDVILDGEDLEIDIEGAAQLGDKLFWAGSHSASKKGKFRAARHRLFAINIECRENGEFSASPAGQIYATLVNDLENDLRFADFKLGTARTIKPKDIGGLSIEGLAATPDGALLIGFRNPLRGDRIIDGFLLEGKALIVKLLNPLEVVEGEKAEFDVPFELDLGGFGIRDLVYYEAENTYLIVGGPYHENEETPTHTRETGRLYRWSGKAGDAPQLLKSADLSGFNIESAFFFPQMESEVTLLSDDGKSGTTNSFRSIIVDLKQ
ncbi:MAG TPA: DUF3616 domain-containing protein [Pyrinomonadaceae bacterium]|jgi:hypothetical protein